MQHRYARIVSGQYTPEAERTDGNIHVFGDVTYVTLTCGHVMLGNPTMYFVPGENQRCNECSQAAED